MEESVSMLPSYAATAWYYGGQKGELADAVARAYQFCADKYVRALYLGGRLPAEDRAQLAKELSSLIGISSHVLLHNDLHVTMADFLRWFQEEHGMTISPYDTRFAGRHTPGLQMHDPVGDDEMMSRCMQGLLGAFQEIRRDVLGIETKRKFNIINFNVNKNWPYVSRCTPFEMLQFLLNRSKKFRIFIGNGVFDLVTSVGQVAYTVSQLKYEEGQVTVREYPAGHMPYLGHHGGDALANDIRTFIREGEKR